MKRNKQTSPAMDILFIASLFFLTRLLLLMIGILTKNEFALHQLVKSPNYIFHANDLVSMWGSFDTGAYLEIARNGYPAFSGNHDAMGLYNFFPLYPTLIYSLHALTGIDHMITGIIISNLSLLFAAWFIYKIAFSLFDETIARSSVLFLFIYPASFFLSGVYSEGLFLFLLAASFYSGLKNKWWLACLFCALLSLCRPTGIFMAIPLLLQYFYIRDFRFKEIKADILGFLLIPIGIGVYIYFNYKMTGDPLFFANNNVWNREFVSPFIRIFEGLTGDYFTYKFLAAWQLLIVITWLFFISKISLPFNIMILLLLFIPACYTIDSIPRMSTVAFPLYIGFATFKKQKTQTAMIYIFSILQGYMAVCWFLGFGNAV